MDIPAGHILILSGSPGSGKTTTAEAIARQPGVPKAHLHTDDFWGWIKTGHVEPWLPEADKQNRMIMDIVACVAERYAREGYFVALDGVIGPWSLPPFRALSVPLHYVVLRPAVSEAVERCQARGGDSLTDPVVVADIHAMFADLGDLQPHLLPTDGLDRAQTRDAVIAAIASGAYRLDRH